MATLSLNGITQQFKDTKVLHGIDLEIHDKEFVVFVGPSGCGKSTLLRLIAGLDPITGGTFYLNGKLMNDIAPSKRGISMVFQSYALYPHMDVYENMAFGIKLMGLSKEEVESRIQEAAQMLKLDGLLKRKPRELSGGQRQRVAIARALVKKPEVFLLDEPLSNLDAALRSDVRLELARLHRDIGGTMIYVTHDQVEAMTLADKIVVMNLGQIEQVGSPRELYERPANTFVATFIGSPKMALLNVTRENGRLVLDDGSSIAAESPDHAGGKLILGVRPDALTVVARSDEDGFKAQVIYTEYLGDDSFIYVKTTEGIVVGVRAQKDVFFDADALVSLKPRTDALHFFSLETGKRI